MRIAVIPRAAPPFQPLLCLFRGSRAHRGSSGGVDSRCGNSALVFCSRPAPGLLATSASSTWRNQPDRPLCFLTSTSLPNIDEPAELKGGAGAQCPDRGPPEESGLGDASLQSCSRCRSSAPSAAPTHQSPHRSTSSVSPWGRVQQLRRCQHCSRKAGADPEALSASLSEGGC